MADVILGSNQFDMLFLAMVFALDGGPQFGIGIGDGLAGGKHGDSAQKLENGDFSPEVSEFCRAHGLAESRQIKNPPHGGSERY
jgi:hypothetical protein